MFKSYILFVAVSISALTLSCSGPDEKRQDAEGENVYEEFRNFVAATEEDAYSEAEAEFADTTSARMEINSLKLEYAKYQAKIDDNSENFAPHQREVLMDLRDRFNTAINKKQRKNEEVHKRYQMRQKLLGIDVHSDDLSEITSDNIKSVYTNFVQTVSQEAATYTGQEWDIAEGLWSALNTRKEQLEDLLKPSDTQAILRQQEQYQAVIQNKTAI